VDEYLFYFGSTEDDVEKRAAWLSEMIGKLADIFLHGSKRYEPLEVWNKPGVIDEYLAEIFPFPSKDPMLRMKTVFLVFFERINNLVETAAKPGVLEEQWQPAWALLLQEFAMMLIGMPIVEPAEPSAVQVQESVVLSGRQKALLERWKDYP
jgi:hypothetical protein